MQIKAPFVTRIIGFVSIRQRRIPMRDGATQAGLLNRVIDWFVDRGWRGGDTSQLSGHDLQLLASDLGVTEADLMDVLPRGPDNRLLMDRMMLARGMDPDKVRRMGVALVRDLELTCTRCRSTSRCGRDLAEGTAADTCHEYCGNADSFDWIMESRVHG